MLPSETEKKYKETTRGDKKDANDSHRKILEYANTKRYNSGFIPKGINPELYRFVL